MKTTRELEHRIRSSKDPAVLADEDFAPPALSDYLHQLLKSRRMTTVEAIQCCNLDRSYGYQLFNGTRRPTRDMLLTLAIHLGLTETETQRVLKLAGRPVLYARNRRDAAVLYCLNRRLSPSETEALLNELEVEPLAAHV